MFKLAIDTGNAAFDGETPHDGTCTAEIVRILREVADKLEGGSLLCEYGGGSFPVRDINGNTVGTASYLPGPHVAPEMESE